MADFELDRFKLIAYKGRVLSVQWMAGYCRTALWLTGWKVQPGTVDTSTQRFEATTTYACFITQQILFLVLTGYAT
jgi:hypothetical protein